MACCAIGGGCGRVAELRPAPGLVKAGKYYVCYLCVVMPERFPQAVAHRDQQGKFAVPDASKQTAVPTVGRKYPSKRKTKH